PHRPGRERGRGRRARGARGDGRGGHAPREARRRPVLVPAKRRSRAQGRELLPLPVPLGDRPRSRSRGRLGRVGRVGGCPPPTGVQGGARDGTGRHVGIGTTPITCLAVFVLNFYSPVFIDQLKRGRK